MIVVILKCEEIKIRESYSNTKTVIKNSITSYFTYKYEVSDSQDDAAAAVFSNQEKKYSLPRENIWQITHWKILLLEKKIFFLTHTLLFIHTLPRLSVPQSRTESIVCIKYNV